MRVAARLGAAALSSCRVQREFPMSAYSALAQAWSAAKGWTAESIAVAFPHCQGRTKQKVLAQSQYCGGGGGSGAEAPYYGGGGGGG